MLDRDDDGGVAKYLISFPSETMVVSDEEFPTVIAESHAVVEEAKAAGVFGDDPAS